MKLCPVAHGFLRGRGFSPDILDVARSAYVAAAGGRVDHKIGATLALHESVLFHTAVGASCWRKLAFGGEFAYHIAALPLYTKL